MRLSVTSDGFLLGMRRNQTARAFVNGSEFGSMEGHHVAQPASGR